jgi:hypothetical protein
MGLTGILLYIKQKAEPIENSHTIFGLLFIVMVCFHIYNNWKSIKNYSTKKETTGMSKTFVLVLVGGIIVLVMAMTEVLEPIAEFGRLFAPKKGPRPEQIAFVEKNINTDKQGQAITLLIQKDQKGMRANVSIDLLDSTGNVLQGIYSTDTVKQQGPPSNLIINTVAPAGNLYFRLITKQEEKAADTLKGSIMGVKPGTYAPISSLGNDIKRFIVEVK